MLSMLLFYLSMFGVSLKFILIKSKKGNLLLFSKNDDQIFHSNFLPDLLTHVFFEFHYEYH